MAISLILGANERIYKTKPFAVDIYRQIFHKCTLISTENRHYISLVNHGSSCWIQATYYVLHAARHKKWNRGTCARASPNQSTREGWKDIWQSCCDVSSCETQWRYPLTIICLGATSILVVTAVTPKNTVLLNTMPGRTSRLSMCIARNSRSPGNDWIIS